jgi:hypothetical protein
VRDLVTENVNATVEQPSSTTGQAI